MSLTTVMITVALVTVATTVVLGLITWTALRARSRRADRARRSAADGPWYFERHTPSTRGRNVAAG